jgi:hypothetical protein
MLRKNIKSDMKYFIILIAIGTFILIPIANVSGAESPPYYIGYTYYGDPGGSAPEGVMSDIYCVSPVIPNRHIIATQFKKQTGIKIQHQYQEKLDTFIEEINEK